MSKKPLNLALAFALEVAALVALGYWGWHTHDGAARLLWTIGLVVAAAAVWGIFRVPGDGGPPTVTVTGRVRLAIEAVFYTGAVIALLAAGQVTLGVVFAALVALHYAISYDRVARFLHAG